MGTSVSKNMINKTTETINRTVSNVVQSVANVMIQNQSLTVNCDENFWDAYQKCYEKNMDLVDKGKILNKEAQDNILKWCPKCSAGRIDMKGAISANITTDQVSTIKSTIDSELTSKLTQDAKNASGLSILGTEVENQINTVVKTVNEQIQNVVQSLNNNIEQRQEITVKSTSEKVEYITMSTVNETIANLIQKNDTVSTAISKMSETLEQKASAGGGGILRMILIVIGIILGLLAILGVVLWIIKRNKDKKALQGTSTGSLPGATRTRSTRKTR